MGNNLKSLESLLVIIVTYNRYTELSKTIFALENEGIGKDSIIIVDNTSKDTRKIIDILSECIWIYPSENIASAGGFALGMKQALSLKADWILLFNDDSRPMPGAIDSLRKGLKKLSDQKVGLLKIGNLTSQGKGILLDWKGVRKPRYVDPSDDPMKTDLVTFDGCLISTSLIKEIGTCDPKFFMGTYEFDFCLKASESGFGIYTIPNGLIDDGKLGSVGGTPPWRQYYNTRNHLWLGLKRKDLSIVWAWIIRELKFSYAILRWEDQKLLRLRYKLLAAFHAVIGERGKVLEPRNSNVSKIS